MNFIISLKKYCKSFLIFLLLLTNFQQKSMEELVKEPQQCDNMVLGSFIPSIDQRSITLSKPPTFKTTDICLTIKTQSCCSDSDLLFLINQMRESLKLMRGRGKYEEKIFERINNIAFETFEIFLNEINDKDKKCYNDYICLLYTSPSPRD